MSKDLAIKYWNTHFQTMIDEKAAATDTIPSAWRAGGRATKAYPEKENDIWWQDNGPKMVDNFIQWWRNNKWSVWNHNGVLQVEPEYNVMFGDILVKSFIDLVAVTPEGDIVIVDYKSGVFPLVVFSAENGKSGTK